MTRNIQFENKWSYDLNAKGVNWDLELWKSVHINRDPDIK